jgi:putative colanic acid biosynthesis UDP-glucose lipid carrier transferase
MLPPIRPEESSFVWLHRFVDLFTPIASLFIITAVLQIDWYERYQVMATLGGFIFIISAQLTGIYRRWRGRAFFTSIKLIASAWVLTWATLIIIAFLYKDTQNFSRLAITVWAISTPALLITYRLIIRLVLIKFRANGKNIKTVAIVGAGKVGRHVASIINNNQWLGYKAVAFFDDNKQLKNTQIDNIDVIDTTNNLTQAVNKNHYNEVYLCLPLREEKKIKAILDKLTDTTAIVKFIPNLFSFDLIHSKWTDLKGIPVISVFDTPINSLTARMVKRTEDIIVASCILVLICPLLFLVAIKVKVSSHGPVIFSQKRYGLNGKKIKIYKFRSMSTQDDGKVIKQVKQNDPRVTKFGAFIRRTSLDELPQFINVIQGRMSVVGPRPHAVAHNEEYRKLVPKYMQRHIVKPGITGWAQINGWRGETNTLEKMQSRIDCDLHYINTWTLWLDIKIIFLTIFKGFINKNAY